MEYIKKSHEGIPLMCLNVTRSPSREGRKRTYDWGQLYHTGTPDHPGRVLKPACGDVEAAGKKILIFKNFTI